MKSNKAIYITQVAIFGVIAAALMLIAIPVFFVPGFYKLEFSETVVLIGAFSLGPFAGVLIELVKLVVVLIFRGTSTFLLGEMANFFMGCSLVLPSAIYYKYHRTLDGAFKSMVIGTFSLMLFAGILNYFLLIPLYSKIFGLPIQKIIDIAHLSSSRITDLASFVIWAVVPFNLIQAMVECFATVVLYKRISRIMEKLKFK